MFSWSLTPCSFLDGYESLESLKGTCYLLQDRWPQDWESYQTAAFIIRSVTRKIEAAVFFDYFLYRRTYQTTRRHIREDCSFGNVRVFLSPYILLQGELFQNIHDRPPPPFQPYRSPFIISLQPISFDFALLSLRNRWSWKWRTKSDPHTTVPSVGKQTQLGSASIVKCRPEIQFRNIPFWKGWETGEQK